MKKEDFAYISCKMFALYWVVMAAYSVSSVILSWMTWKEGISNSSHQFEGILYLSFVPFLFYLTVSILFWFGSKKIARGLIPTDSSSTNAEGISLHQAQVIVFSAVAIFLLCSSFPEIGGLLYKIHLAKKFDSYTEFSFGDKALVLEISIRLGLGVLLLFGGKGLSGMLIKLRKLGVK